MIQIFGTKKCKDTQKAIRFFKERNIQIHFVDLADKGISPGELRSINRSIALEDLIDRDGKQFRKRNLQYMKFNIEAELLDDPLLLKTPIVRYKQQSSLGFQPGTWQQWTAEIKS